MLKKAHKKANKATKPVVKKSPAKPKAKAPKAKKEEAPKHDPVFEEIQAPYQFTPEERARMSEELRGFLDKIDATKDQQKAANADFKLRIQNDETAAKALRLKLGNGTESRPVKARVEFEVEKRIKHLFHPESGELIRTDPMQPADFQLPMFLPVEDGKKEVVAPAGAQDVPTGPSAPKPAKKGKKAPETGAPGDNAGQSNVGAALNAAAALTDVPKLKLSFDPTTADHVAITRGFVKCAKAAGWNEVQIGVIKDALRACDSEPKMLEVLQPHIEQPTGEQEPAAE